MTQVQKNTFISFISAIILGIVFSGKVGDIYLLVTNSTPGSIFVGTPGVSLDGFAFVYSFILSLLLQLFVGSKKATKYSIVGMLPFLFVILIDTDWRYFIALLATALFGGAFGFGIRWLTSKFSSRKQEKAM